VVAAPRRARLRSLFEDSVSAVATTLAEREKVSSDCWDQRPVD